MRVPASATLPGTYPHVLAQRLQLTLLSERAFPFPPVGLVHLENRILQHRAIPVDEALELTVRATRAQPHPRGHTFTIITTAAIARETVWQSASTMLHRDRKYKREARAAGRALAHGREAGEGASHDAWTLQRDLGRRYASASGDRNPIHTHLLAARVLGFRGVIAHGMSTKARALAALAHELPDSYGIEATFRSPIVLPNTVQLSTRESPGETEFTVRATATGRTHLRGRTWAASRTDGSANGSAVA